MVTLYSIPDFLRPPDHVPPVLLLVSVRGHQLGVVEVVLLGVALFERPREAQDDGVIVIASQRGEEALRNKVLARLALPA